MGGLQPVAAAGDTVTIEMEREVKKAGARTNTLWVYIVEAGRRERRGSVGLAFIWRNQARMRMMKSGIWRYAFVVICSPGW